MSDEWKTIKVKKETYEELKKMDEGISKAVDMLVKAQKEALQRKIIDLEKSAGEIADILLRSGIFSVKFRGAGISGLEENGSILTIRGFINIDIPNPEARAEIVRILKGGEEDEQD